MIQKIAALLNSVRFWQVTGATAFILAGHYLPDQSFLWNSLAGWLAAVAGIGTLDSVATKMAGTTGDTTVNVSNPSDTASVNVT